MMLLSTLALCLAGAVTGVIAGALRVGGLIAFLAMWIVFAGLILAAGSNPLGYLVSPAGWIPIGIVAFIYVTIAVWASDHAANARNRAGHPGS
jgi:hypothetical protein